jgi:hypothetical protein
MGTRPKLVSAPRVLVYINGKLYGRCTTFQWSSITPRRRIHVCDIAVPVELAATTTDVTWQMGVLRVIGDGGAQGSGIVADQLNISREKYFTLTLIERQTDMVLFQADLCNTDSEIWSIAPKGLMQGQISGSGITWVNEASSQ